MSVDVAESSAEQNGVCSSRFYSEDLHGFAAGPGDVRGERGDELARIYVVGVGAGHRLNRAIGQFDFGEGAADDNEVTHLCACVHDAVQGPWQVGPWGFSDQGGIGCGRAFRPSGQRRDGDEADASYEESDE